MSKAPVVEATSAASSEINSCSLPLQHPPIIVDSVSHDLSHLTAFEAVMPGKGLVAGTDLKFLVVFSNHVFTERAKHKEPHDVKDHYGTKRRFDADRYEMSKILALTIKAKIAANDVTHVSKSFGDIDNLILLQTEDGRIWTIVYCLEPISNNTAVRMEVLSCHPKVVSQKNIKRQHLSYYARKCLADGCRTPK